MVLLGLLFLLLSLFVVGAKVLFWVGLILICVGLFLNFGPTDGVRRRYY